MRQQGLARTPAERGRVASFEPARRRGFGLVSFSGVGALSSGALAAGGLAADALAAGAGAAALGGADGFAASDACFGFSFCLS